MVVHDIGKGSMEGSEDVFIGGDDGGLVTITTGQVLRSDDRDMLPGSGLYQDHLGMVIGEIGVLDDAREERPEAKRFLRSLKSRMRWIASTFPDLLMKNKRRRNSSEMEKEVCQMVALPTCSSTHSTTSATCKVFVR